MKQYPRLTQVGAWRGAGRRRHGGYYSRAEIKDLVAFARDRFIEAVPEIEMPSHSQAALGVSNGPASV